MQMRTGTTHNFCSIRIKYFWKELTKVDHPLKGGKQFQSIPVINFPWKNKCFAKSLFYIAEKIVLN